MERAKQLELWLKGKPIHNDETNECCPDFSCCKPSLLVDYPVREMFYLSYIEKNNEMINHLLMFFLSRAIASIINVDNNKRR